MSAVHRLGFGRDTAQRPPRRGRATVLFLLLATAAFAGDQAKPQAASWAPPDIDQVSAPVNLESPCAVDAVVSKASRRVQDLVLNMQRFSATEDVEFSEVDRQGVLRPSNKAVFSYVAYIHESLPQQLLVEEYRDDTVSVRKFPSKLATIGTAAFALILHPDYLKDYDVTCEGLSDWQGRRAWRLHLTQVKPNNFRHYRVAGRSYALMLKARAWIDAETFEVLRLETDLRDPVRQIPLLLEHVIVDYATVDFPRRKLQLWLPREADIYMDCRGHQYRHRHTFTNFKLFWVDTDQKVKTPAAVAEAPPETPGVKSLLQPPAPAPADQPAPR